MADALEEQGASPDDAVIALAPMDWAAAKGRLAVLKSPTYSAVVPESAAAEGAANRVDLRAVIEKEGLDAAKAAATEAVVGHRLARPAPAGRGRQPVPARSPKSASTSLMATELASSLEDRFGLEMPFSASASGLSVTGLVNQIIGFAGGPSSANGSAEAPAPVAQALAERHLENTSEETIASLSRLIEQAGQQNRRTALSSRKGGGLSDAERDALLTHVVARGGVKRPAAAEQPKERRAGEFSALPGYRELIMQRSLGSRARLRGPVLSAARRDAQVPRRGSAAGRSSISPPTTISA